jgi:hypothetical protein
MQRANESLIARGYVTWFDLTNMKGELQLYLSICLSSLLRCTSILHALLSLCVWVSVLSVLLSMSMHYACGCLLLHTMQRNATERVQVARLMR